METKFIFILISLFSLLFLFLQKFPQIYQDFAFSSQISQISEKTSKISKEIEKLSLKIKELNSSLEELQSSILAFKESLERRKADFFEEKMRERKETEQKIAESSKNEKEIEKSSEQENADKENANEKEVKIKEANLPQISLSFPKEVFANEEFSVSISVSNLKEKNYDLKISVKGGGKVLSEIFDSKRKFWQSSRYYLANFFFGKNFSGNFKLKIKEENFSGEAQILAKVRESKTKEIVLEFSEGIKVKQKETSITSSSQTSQPQVKKDCVDINSASKEELMEIYGVGETIAQRIIEARPFSSLDDLLRVKGIGEKRLAKIKEQGLACVK